MKYEIKTVHLEQLWQKYSYNITHFKNEYEINGLTFMRTKSTNNFLFKIHVNKIVLTCLFNCTL